MRAFDNPEIIHEEGEVDALRDLEIIHHELIAKDKQHLERALEEIEKAISKKNLKLDRDERDVLLMVQALFEADKNVRDGEWRGPHVEYLNKH